MLKYIIIRGWTYCMFFVTIHKTSRKKLFSCTIFVQLLQSKQIKRLSTISSIYKIAQNIRKCKFCTKINIIITVNINIVVKQVNSLFY